ncbi:MAG: class I SAM-dependent methyltransferase [Cytophagaceae bacterium]
MMIYHSEPVKTFQHKGKSIASFMKSGQGNVDQDTVSSFGHEWTEFNSFREDEVRIAGDQYFDIVDSAVVGKESSVLDIGCGMGRWSYYIADRVKFVEAIDPSEAVFSASEFTSKKNNIRVTQAGVDDIPFADNSFDLVFSLGVLHHVPDTQAAIQQAVKKVKKGGHFMVYLYYSLDNRGFLFKGLFHLSNILRLIISRLPARLKSLVCDCLALMLYMPFVLFSRLIKKISPAGSLYKKIPLSYYSDKSMKIIRNDSLDRFGTPLEQRFSKIQIEEMMKKAGLSNIRFSPNEPYWHALGKKA